MLDLLQVGFDVATGGFTSPGFDQGVVDLFLRNVTITIHIQEGEKGTTFLGGRLDHIVFETTSELLEVDQAVPIGVIARHQSCDVVVKGLILFRGLSDLLKYQRDLGIAAV